MRFVRKRLFSAASRAQPDDVSYRLQLKRDDTPDELGAGSDGVFIVSGAIRCREAR